MNDKTYINKEYSANYSNTNHNFIIQNLFNYSIQTDPKKKYLLPILYVLKNILQRGKPTLMSLNLQDRLTSIHKDDNFSEHLPLIDNSNLEWKRIIKGFDKNNFFPARKFYDEIIPNYFGEYRFIKNLLMPEINLNEITKIDNSDFIDQQVDFYLPQARLIIEIDGSQHKNDLINDQNRDDYTRRFGITTIRLTTEEINYETESLKNKIESIISHIKNMIDLGKTRKEKVLSSISLDDYKTKFNDLASSPNDYRLIATAVIRIQILLLDLLENDTLSFERAWNFQVKVHDVSEFVSMAIEDIFIWLDNLVSLNDIHYTRPTYSVTYLEPDEDFIEDTNSVKIDFSLMQRYTDHYEDKRDVIFVRTHYLDQYVFYPSSSSNDLKAHKYVDYDYFQLAMTDEIKYIFNEYNFQQKKDNLVFLLSNIFLQDINDVDFREGQLEVITNSMMRNDTIGLLPTGSGKSICYQLTAMLQPATSFVVSPIKALMYDQKLDLDKIYISRTNLITSDLTGEEKQLVQSQYAQGKYFFIFISPERFQNKEFRTYINAIDNRNKISYAIIDEVHCLSEWGHDFRTSYLNLSNTIGSLASRAKYIGLTATASVNVLNDIQKEFNIDDVDVRTPLNYTREELEFKTLNDKGLKLKNVINLLESMDTQMSIFENQDKDTKCGIIFTPHVNGKLGCFYLANSLENHFKQPIKYYSGQKPKDSEFHDDNEYSVYKNNIQNDFKDNKFNLMVATKAFGMGVNKGNIFYTIHYGLPQSMESLYQEAGRAGRDKQLFKEQKACCYVLLTPEKIDINNKLWDPDISLDDLKSIKTTRQGDINTNLYMLTMGLDSVNDEFILIKIILEKYYYEDELIQVIYSKDIGANKIKTEKAIYRLSQLDIVSDWTVEDFFKGIFEVVFKKYNEEGVLLSLTTMIHKYDSKWNIETEKSSENKFYQYIFKDNKNRFTILEQYILVLLVWSYKHFVGNRRQSLKTVYDHCLALSQTYKVVDGGKKIKYTQNDFKNDLEGYFKFNKTTSVFQAIANKPTDYSLWFDVFYEYSSDEDVVSLINIKTINERNNQISRFLESYLSNTGLNFISGIFRLLLDDYNNADGRVRLERSLNDIKSFSKDDGQKIFTNILQLAKYMNHIQKSKLVESIDKVYNDKDIMNVIYNELGDSYSLNILLESQFEKLRNITKTIRKKVYSE